MGHPVPGRRTHHRRRQQLSTTKITTIRSKELREAVSAVLALGWTLGKSGAGHPYVLSPDGTTRIGMSGTPRCRNAHNQFKRDLRKYAGVEL
jgi:hypothetical protein